jgi:excisionase family DNA binding protein
MDCGNRCDCAAIGIGHFGGQPMTPEQKHFPLFLTLDEAAAYSGLSRDQIQQAADSRTDPLPHFRRGRRYYIHRADIDPYFARMCVNGTQ